MRTNRALHKTPPPNNCGGCFARRVERKESGLFDDSTTFITSQLFHSSFALITMVLLIWHSRNEYDITWRVLAAPAIGKDQRAGLDIAGDDIWNFDRQGLQFYDDCVKFLTGR